MRHYFLQGGDITCLARRYLDMARKIRLNVTYHASVPPGDMLAIISSREILTICAYRHAATFITLMSLEKRYHNITSTLA